MKLSIARDFSPIPGGIDEQQTEYSATVFLETILRPKVIQAKKRNEPLEIDLDGCMGYPTSFIKESFAKLAQEMEDPTIFDNVKFISQDQPGLVDYIMKLVKGDKLV